MLHPVRSALFVLLALGGAASEATAEGPPDYVVIVNPANDVNELDRRFVADAFLKKVTRWPGGAVIKPADLPTNFPARNAFSRDLLGRSVTAVKSYWEQIIYSGRGVPPPELSNDEEVLKYVLKHEGGIGYVSADADVSAVRVVSLK